jgi:anti-anti-sigma regulatory factor
MSFIVTHRDTPRETLLEAGGALEIRDVEADHRLLAQALEAGNPLSIDLKGVVTVDAAGVQLLLALKQEGMRRGLSVEFRGHSPAMAHALTLLGLAPDFSGCVAS